MGVFTLFTLFTLTFDSAGWLIECKNCFVKVRGSRFIPNAKARWLNFHPTAFLDLQDLQDLQRFLMVHNGEFDCKTKLLMCIFAYRCNWAYYSTFVLFFQIVLIPLSMLKRSSSVSHPMHGGSQLFLPFASLTLRFHCGHRPGIFDLGNPMVLPSLEGGSDRVEDPSKIPASKRRVD